MSKSNDDEKAQRKFKEQLREFGFTGEREFTPEEMRRFSRHSANVLQKRALLDEE